MPSSSYIRQNDYRVQEFKPYETPYASTLQEIATKNAYWQQGAQKIKASLDAAIGLDPQFLQNKEYMKDFIEKANNQLSRAAKSDLSQQDNVGAAISIFKPLYDTNNEFNKNLLTDSQTNTFYKQQQSAADAARSTNGGKTWNQNNEFYMKSGYQKYLQDAQSGNINTIGDHWNKKKAYIPYYDYSDDLKQAIKNCHEDSVETSENQSGTLYLHTVSNKGLSQSKVQNCIDFMPPQAKQQIGIDSYASYYNNPQGLLTDYQNLVYNNAKEQRDGIASQLAAARLKGDKSQVAQLQQAYTQLNTQFEQGQKEYNQMLNGQDGMKFLNDNYDRVAATVGMQHFSERAGKTFAWNDIKNKLSPDAAAIATAHINADAASQQSQQQFQLGLEGLKHQNALEIESFKMYGKVKPGEILPDGTVAGDVKKEDVLVNPTNPEVEDPEGSLKTEIKNGYISSGAALETLTNLIAPYINSDEAAKTLYTNTNNKKVDINTLINFVDQYQKSTGINDDRITNQLNVLRKIKTDIQNKEFQYKTLSNKADAELGNTFDNKNALPTNIKYSNGQPLTLTQRDLVDIKLGKNVKGFTYAQTSEQVRTLRGTYSDEKGTFFFNGKPISTSILGQAGGLSLGIKDKFDQYQEKRKAYFQNNYLTSQGIFTTGDTEKLSKGREESIKTKLGIGSNDDYVVSAEHRGNDGSAYVRVIKKGKGEKDNENLSEKQLKALNPLNQNITFVRLGGNDGNVYAKIPDVFSPLEGFISGENQYNLKTFSNYQLQNLKSGQSSSNLNSSDGYMNMNSPSGVPLRISVTNMNGAPFYTFEIYSRGKYIRNPSSYTNEIELLTAISKLPANQ